MRALQLCAGISMGHGRCDRGTKVGPFFKEGNRMVIRTECKEFVGEKKIPDDLLQLSA